MGMLFIHMSPTVWCGVWMPHKNVCMKWMLYIIKWTNIFFNKSELYYVVTLHNTLDPAEILYVFHRSASHVMPNFSPFFLRVCACEHNLMVFIALVAFFETWISYSFRFVFLIICIMKSISYTVSCTTHYVRFRLRILFLIIWKHFGLPMYKIWEAF